MPEHPAERPQPCGWRIRSVPPISIARLLAALASAASRPIIAAMQHIFRLFVQLLSRLAILLLKPGGVESLLAENLLLRQQLLLLRRSRRRSPNLRPSDRLFFGLTSLWLY